MSKVPAKTFCDQCNRFREDHEQGWQQLSWIGRPATHYVDDGIQVWAKSVGTGSPKDLCSWKCVRDYAQKFHIIETESS